MNEALIRKALALIYHVPTDLTLRAGLLSTGFAPDDVDRHLEWMVEERLISFHPSANQLPLWRLKLGGKHLLDLPERLPIGFDLP